MHSGAWPHEGKSDKRGKADKEFDSTPKKERPDSQPAHLRRSVAIGSCTELELLNAVVIFISCDPDPTEPGSGQGCVSCLLIDKQNWNLVSKQQCAKTIRRCVWEIDCKQAHTYLDSFRLHVARKLARGTFVRCELCLCTRRSAWQPDSVTRTQQNAHILLTSHHHHNTQTKRTDVLAHTFAFDHGQEVGGAEVSKELEAANDRAHDGWSNTQHSNIQMSRPQAKSSAEMIVAQSRFCQVLWPRITDPQHHADFRSLAGRGARPDTVKHMRTRAFHNMFFF